ncbi:hypothetical protein QDR37_14945 [Amnibacterium sp. CER49]|uniref:hypothetical protein n=1 Tax=Amnibacterium sp. CER49 TaxID=3039161 RepID=UPI00244BA66F|nr:hypothetical protein [Amnibacterium sp. CER49]MDH2445248.1 hypothetical protein [Amnibacterium sp. CER49]
MTLASEHDLTPAVAPVAPAVAVESAADLVARRIPALRLPRLRQQYYPARTSLGTGFLGIAANVVAVLLLCFDVARFATEWHTYPTPGFAAAAWLLLAGLLVALAFASRSAGDQLNAYVSWAIVGGLGVVVLLDAIAVWGDPDLGHDLTAGPATALVLLAMVGVRTSRSILLAAGVLGLLLGVLVLASWAAFPPPVDGAEGAVAMLCRTLLPPVLGALIVHMFRRVIGRELERVLVQSTVSAPRFSVGMMASEELARLDLAAEQLLDSVATGRTRLPLNAAAAQAAAELATELRLHLIEGRRQTWLYHAISESELLGRAVTLSDPESLAGLLDQRQRDGLLQAVWLLLGDSPQRSRRSAARVTVEITVGPARPREGKERTMRVPIVLSTTGVARHRVDPATWDAVRKVGRHADSSRSGSLCVEIDCVVDRPAER